jgi:hypothetical protein
VHEQTLPEDGWQHDERELRERWKRDETPVASRFPELVRAFKERAG